MRALSVVGAIGNSCAGAASVWSNSVEDQTRAICGYGHVDMEPGRVFRTMRAWCCTRRRVGARDHFAVYEVPIPDVFQSEAGRRRIRVTLAFDPPVRHTRVDYAGVTMSFRLKRGCDSEPGSRAFPETDERRGTCPRHRELVRLRPKARRQQLREKGTACKRPPSRFKPKCGLSEYTAIATIWSCVAGAAGRRDMVQRQLVR